METETVSNVTPISEILSDKVEVNQALPSSEASSGVGQISERVNLSEVDSPQVHQPSLLSEALAENEPAKERDGAESHASVLDKEKGILPTEEIKKEALQEEVKPPLEPMKYEDFKVPENLGDGIKIDKDQVNEYTKIIGEYRVPQEAAQKLMDMYLNGVKTVQDRMVQTQWDVFNNIQTEWRNQVLSDPIIGGAGHDTAMQKIASVRNMLVPRERMKAFNEFLNITGAGNHPEFIHMMYRASKILDTPEPPKSQANPVHERGPKSLTKSEILYGNT